MTATPDLFALVVVIPLTFEVIRRTPAAVRNDKSRSLWTFLVLMDVVMAIRISFVGDLINKTTGLQDGIILVKTITGFIAVGLLIQWVSTVVPGRMDGQRESRYRRAISSRPRRIATWTGIVASAALFPLAVRVSDGRHDSLFLQAGHFWGSMHLILFYTYMIFGLVCASMMFSAASRDPKAEGAFKYGMQAMAVGCSCAVVYGALRSGYLIVRLFDKPFLGGEAFVDVASNFALSGFGLLMLTGSTAPMWERMSARVEMHEAINDLRPMWTTLTYAVPSVVYRSRRERWVIRVLAPRAPRLIKTLCRTCRAVTDFWNWRGLDQRLHRRVTEICDASIRLRPYLPTGTCDEAVEIAKELGLPEHAAPAYLLNTAMRLKKSGSEPHSGNPGCPILQPSDDPLATTAMLLPIGKAMTNPVLLGKFHRRHRETV